MGALSFLAPLLPYIAGLIAMVIGYFTIRQRGVVAARQRQEKAQVKVQQAVVKAQSKDAAIDEKVEKKIEEIRETHPVEPVSGDRFKF
mgnify:FL=1